MVNHVLDNSDRKIESVLADGAIDINSNFKYFEMNKKAWNKVRKNSIISIKNNTLRKREVKLQIKENLLKWKMKRKYGYRWIAKETAFSTIKRMFGEYVSATRFQNMVNEMMIKVSLYNLFRRI